MIARSFKIENMTSGMHAVNDRDGFDYCMDKVEKSGRTATPDEKDMSFFTAVEIIEVGDINIIYQRCKVYYIKGTVLKMSLPSRHM